MGTYRCDMMSGDEVDKLLAIAIAAVLIEESAGLSIRPSEGRREGSKWSIDPVSYTHLTLPTIYSV